jgi:hypothetical protein
MLLKPLVWVCAFSVCTLWLGAGVRADSPLTEMDQEIAQRYGKGIADLFAKPYKDPQVKIDADPEKAVGLYNPDTNEGIIAIPVKGWKEDPGSKEAEQGNGRPMCYLLMSSTYNPFIDGKPIDAKKLRSVKLKRNGEERDVTCFVCSLKHNGGNEWLLQLYGADKEPVIKAPFKADSDAPKQDLALTLKDGKDDKASLVFSTFGKYASSITIGTKGK